MFCTLVSGTVGINADTNGGPILHGAETSGGRLPPLGGGNTARKCAVPRQRSDAVSGIIEQVPQRFDSRNSPVLPARGPEQPDATPGATGPPPTRLLPVRNAD